MSPEPTPAAPVVTPDPTPTPTPGAGEPSETFIDANGKFTEGWKEHYVPEELRADKVYDTFDDVAGSLKMLGSLQSMIGKKGIVIPGEASSPTEWDNYFRERGRPDTKDQYVMKVPEDIAEQYNDNFIADARDMVYKMGLNQKEVSALWEYEENRIRAGLKMQADALAEADETFTKWGEANPKKLHLANRMIAENVTDDEHKKAVLEAIDNSVDVANLLANVAAKFMEHKIITDTGAPSGITASEALLKAKQIEQTPGFLLPDDKGQLLRDVNRPEYDRLEKERTKLYQLANTKPG